MGYYWARRVGATARPHPGKHARNHWGSKWFQIDPKMVPKWSQSGPWGIKIYPLKIKTVKMEPRGLQGAPRRVQNRLSSITERPQLAQDEFKMPPRDAQRDPRMDYRSTNEGQRETKRPQKGKGGGPRDWETEKNVNVEMMKIQMFLKLKSTSGCPVLDSEGFMFAHVGPFYVHGGLLWVTWCHDGSTWDHDDAAWLSISTIIDPSRAW